MFSSGTSQILAASLRAQAAWLHLSGDEANARNAHLLAGNMQTMPVTENPLLAALVAVGFQEFDARKLGNYGYGRFPDVVTSLEYEMSQLESTLRNLRQETSNLRLEAASLRSPERIERVARRDLHLRLPSADQVITVD